MNTGQFGIQVSSTGESLNVSIHPCLCMDVVYVCVMLMYHVVVKITLFSLIYAHMPYDAKLCQDKIPTNGSINNLDESNL